MTAEKKRPTEVDPAETEKAEVTPISPDIETSEYTPIEINLDVVANIVRHTALDVPGVVSLTSGGLTGGLREYFKGKDPGTQVTQDENGAYIIEVKLIMRFGVELIEVAKTVQRLVSEKVEYMTGNTVARVNVKIDGVRAEGERASAEEDEFLEPHND